MKKLTAIAASAALAMSASLAMPQQANARAKDEVDLCRSLVDAQLFDSIGDCVGLLRSAPADICKDYDTGFLVFFKFKNRGDCMSFFRSIN